MCVSLHINMIKSRCLDETWTNTDRNEIRGVTDAHSSLKMFVKFWDATFKTKTTHTTLIWAYTDKWRSNLAELKGGLQNYTSSASNLGHFWDADIPN